MRIEDYLAASIESIDHHSSDSYQLTSGRGEGVSNDEAAIHISRAMQAPSHSDPT